MIYANLVAANIQLSSLIANAAAQALELDNLEANAQVQQSFMEALQSNAATQATQINLINANITAANTNISSLNSVSGSQTLNINLLNANVAAANINISTLFTNAAFQASSIDNLYANVNFYLANVASSNANIAAANAQIIVLQQSLNNSLANVTALQANAATQGNQINLLNANVSAKANLSGAVFSGNVQADYLIANANVKIGQIVEVGGSTATDFPSKAGLFVGDVNSYYQLVLQNINSGSKASTDIVLTANDGTDTDGYIDIGINGSGWHGNFTVPAGDTGLQEFAHDGYFEVIGGNAAIRTDSNVYFAANTKIVGLQKDGNFTLLNTNLQFKDGSVITSLLDATAYTPNNAANYNQTITNIKQALDELAARLRHLGG